MRTLILIPLLLATATGLAAAGPSARQLWPTDPGNHWEFRAVAPDGTVSTRRLSVVSASGGWRSIDGLDGRHWWWPSGVTPRLWVWNFSTGSYSLAFDFRAGAGARFTSRAADLRCLDGAVWRISRADARSVLIERVAGGCAEGGLLRLELVKGIGPVALAWSGAAGPTVARLVGARISGKEVTPPGSGIPPRPAGALTGSAFIEKTRLLSRAERERRILAELLSGNVPGFLRELKTIRFTGQDVDGRAREVTLRVLPDYLAIGSDRDHVRIPVSPVTAQKVADAWGFSLPTRKLVDEIWRQAPVRLAPRPMTPGPAMMSNAYFLAHQRTIERQLAGRAPGQLTAGHKKDVVITPRLAVRPGKVAIYGWHLTSGRPIQPLSTLHILSYADYSHGARLVLARATLDGEPVTLPALLRDPRLAGLVSDEGPIAAPRYPTD